MKNYLQNYIKYIDECLKDKNINMKELKKEHLTKISFFQHERFIHLIVTLFYVLFMLVFLGLGAVFIGFLIAGIILLIIVLLYVVHYFRLENGVQYLYIQYDKMNEKS